MSVKAQNSNSDGNGGSTNTKVDDDDNTNATYKNLTNEKIELIVSKLKDHYYEGKRNDIIFGLAGLLFKSNIALPGAKELVVKLCDFTHDEQKSNRLEVAEDTYTKGINGEDIKGYVHLVEIFTKKRFNGDSNSAVRLVKDISEVLNECDSKGNDDAGKTAAQILIEDNAVLLFKDQYGIPHAKVRIADHSEIIVIETKKFEYYISKLYFDRTY